MNNRSNQVEPLCMTSEKGEVFFFADEKEDKIIDIAGRIIEAFAFQSASEIAFLLETNRKTVQSFNEGKEFPSTEILLSIHKLIGVSIHWLVTGEGTKYLNSKEHLALPKNRLF